MRPSKEALVKRFGPWPLLFLVTPRLDLPSMLIDRRPTQLQDRQTCSQMTLLSLRDIAIALARSSANGADDTWII